MAFQAYVEIEYVPSNINLIPESSQQNNVSSIGDVQQFDKTKGFKGLYLNGGSVVNGKDVGTLLNGDYKLFPDEGYPGWNGNELSGTMDTGNGYAFATPQEIKLTVSGVAALRYMTIVFDSVAGEYATEWRLSTDSATTVRNNNRYMIIVKVPDVTTEISIIITKWSKANSVAKITSIRAGYVGEYGPSELKEVDIEDEDRPVPTELRFGLSSISGTLKIYNMDYEFQTLIENDLLQDKLDVNIYASEVVNPGTSVYPVLVGSFKSLSWKTDENTPLVSLELTDRLQDLKQIQLTGYTLAQRTGLELFEKIFSELRWVKGVDYAYVDWDGGVPNANSVSQTEQELRLYTFPNSAGAFDNAYNLLEAVCIVTMCRIYTNTQGLVCIKTAWAQ